MATFVVRTSFLAPLVSSQRACRPRRRPEPNGRVHFLSASPHSPEERPQRAHRRELTPASSCALLAASQPTKLHPQLCREPLFTSHPLARRETHR